MVLQSQRQAGGRGGQGRVPLHRTSLIFFLLVVFIEFRCLRCLLISGIVALLILLLIAVIAIIAAVRDNPTKKKGDEVRDHILSLGFA